MGNERPLMPRATFEVRLAEIIAMLRAERGMSPAARRAAWLWVFDIADRYDRLERGEREN